MSVVSRNLFMVSNRLHSPGTWSLAFIFSKWVFSIVLTTYHYFFIIKVMLLFFSWFMLMTLLSLVLMQPPSIILYLICPKCFTWRTLESYLFFWHTGCSLKLYTYSLILVMILTSQIRTWRCQAHWHTSCFRHSTQCFLWCFFFRCHLVSPNDWLLPVSHIQQARYHIYCALCLSIHAGTTWPPFYCCQEDFLVFKGHHQRWASLNQKLIGFGDANWIGAWHDKHSTIWFCNFYGSKPTFLGWKETSNRL